MENFESSIPEICFELLYKMDINGKELEQILYVSDRFVFTNNAEKKVLYLPQKKKQYVVDTERQQLKEIDLSPHVKQLEQLISMTGEIKSNVLDDLPTKNLNIRHLRLFNLPSSPVKFNADLQVIEYPGLEKTVYHQFYVFQANMQLFKIDLKADEIVKYIETSLTINGQEQKSTIELVKITKKTTDNLDFNSFTKYKII
jgi:hypothetical protein